MSILCWPLRLTELNFVAVEGREKKNIWMFPSGGSRISHWRGGADLRRGRFLAKMYAKTKELDPIGGQGAGGTPLDLPMFPHWSPPCPPLQHYLLSWKSVGNIRV